MIRGSEVASLHDPARNNAYIRMWAESYCFKVEVLAGFLATLGFSRHREGRYLGGIGMLSDVLLGYRCKIC